ncbi:MAG: efflux RND transporter periplasmic adaptor subunit, partial [Pseudomonadota bacterium]
MPRSVLTAILLFAAIVTYFGLRMAFAERGDTSDAPAADATESQGTRPEVLVRPIELEEHTVFATLKGQTEPLRTVSVRAETAGAVSGTPIQEGALVRRGAVLCQLDIEAREVRVRQAQAELDSRTLDHEAAQELVKDGLTPVTTAAAARAAFDAAQANLEAARIELERTRLRAPFNGVFERRDAELGDYLSPGAPCGTVVDLDPILVVVQATESLAALLSEGQNAQVSLIDGRSFDGTVRFVGKTADRSTRTFRIEVEMPNPDAAISAGLTASIRILTGDAP